MKQRLLWRRHILQAAGWRGGFWETTRRTWKEWLIVQLNLVMLENIFMKKILFTSLCSINKCICTQKVYLSNNDNIIFVTSLCSLLSFGAGTFCSRWRLSCVIFCYHHLSSNYFYLITFIYYFYCRGAECWWPFALRNQRFRKKVF